MSVSRRKKQAVIFAFLILIIIAIDQCLKILVKLRLEVGESVPIIKHILHITFVKNTGAAFGLFKNSTLIFIAISIGAVIFITQLILRSIRRGDFFSSPVFDFGLIFIMAGALGNLIDRLRFAYVVDFIDVRIWPVFNIADASISVGTFLLIISFIFSRKRGAQ